MHLSLLAFRSPCFDWKIVVVNDSNNQVLTTHCQTNGDDIGTKTLYSYEHQEFQCPVLVRERTVASCDLTLGKLRGRFSVFDWDRDRRRCADKACLWHVDENGVFLAINGGELVLQYPWPK
ncbi:hypothetical protein Salat_1728200 [Sesamum alatum]|uniref:S-protein homolog n=1 Tax=Sesamum alatum TaxID=300844 RepID=A0AAE2CKC6_9LAMI|nr:hypothetical protein Salat_1728200 [Sesamum alatum]